MTDSEALQERLGYRFLRPALLVRALTHRSRTAEKPPTPENADNEPLEFLGDAVLGFLVSEELFQRHPEAKEGQLSQLKAQVVSAQHLHSRALQLDLGRFLLLGHGEERSGGRERKRLLANAMEAIIAAIHLDGGLEAARRFVLQHVLDDEAVADPENAGALNHKSALQAHAQKAGLPLPKYAVVAVTGPEHAKEFTVEVRIGDRCCCGSGTSKKAASQAAAEAFMAEIGSLA
jgi:ribonuclease III